MAAVLRSKYLHNDGVVVRSEAFCADAAAVQVTLWFLNSTKGHGSNVSDARCLGDAGVIAGTASFSPGQVVQYQRFYRFTPSQCAACGQRIGRPLPPNCMSRVYSGNIDSMSVPCARLNATAGRSRAADVLVVDAEGQDAAIVRRYLEIARARPPRVVVYEHSHLRRGQRDDLAQRLRAAGMTQHEPHLLGRANSALRAAHRGMPMWSALGRALSKLDARDNSVWVGSLDGLTST